MAQVGLLRARMRARLAARTDPWRRDSTGPAAPENRRSRQSTVMLRLAGDLGFFTAGLVAWLLVGIVRLARRFER